MLNTEKTKRILIFEYFLQAYNVRFNSSIYLVKILIPKKQLKKSNISENSIYYSNMY